MQTCPTCRFIIPEGATECRVCRGDAGAVVVDRSLPRPGTKPARRTANSRLGRLRHRAADALTRNRRHLALTLVSLVAVVATTLVVAPDPKPAPSPTVQDVEAADALAWQLLERPEEVFRIEVPGTPTGQPADAGTQYRVDLGGLVIVVGTVPIGAELPDPLTYLRTVAARTATTLHATVAERGTVEHPWGPGLDVRLDATDVVVLLHLTVANGRLYVIEGDFVPDLANRPDSQALATYERTVASFAPLS